jgi:hypothetical protein
LLVLNPYLIAGVFSATAGTLAMAGEARLVPAALLAALIAGWSSAWSP